MEDKQTRTNDWSAWTEALAAYSVPCWIPKDDASAAFLFFDVSVDMLSLLLSWRYCLGMPARIGGRIVQWMCCGLIVGGNRLLLC